MSQTITLTVVEREARDGRWRLERASLESPERAIQSWLRSRAMSAPVAHEPRSDVYAPELRSHAPVRARRCRVTIPDLGRRGLPLRLALAVLRSLAGLLRLMLLSPKRPGHARPYPSRSRGR